MRIYPAFGGLILTLGVCTASYAVDDLPPGALARLGSDRMRVANNVHGLQFSPDSRWLLAADREEVWVWEPATGKRLYRFAYPKEGVISGRATTEASLALLCKGDKTLLIRHLDPRNPTESRVVPLTLNQESQSGFDRTGRWLGLAHKNRFWLLDAHSGKELWSQQLPGPITEPPAFSRDGKNVFICLGDQIRNFEAGSGQTNSTLMIPGKKGILSQLTISPDGKRLAAASGRNEANVVVWNTKTAEIVRQFSPAVRPLGFMPDSRTLVVAHVNGVAVHDEQTGNAIRDMELSPVANLTLSPDGATLATQANDAILLFDSRTGKPLPHSADPPGLPSDFRFHSATRLTGKHTSWGGWISWDLKTGSSSPLRPPLVGEGIPVDLSADGRLALFRTDKGIRLIEVPTGKELLFHEVNLRSDQPAAGLSADGTRIVVASYEGITILKLGEPKRVIPRNANEHGPAQLFALSGDGRWAAVESHSPVSDRQHLQLIDLELGQVHSTEVIDGPAYSLQFSADGRRLAVGMTQFDHRSDSRYICWVYDREDRRFIFKTPVEPADRAPLICLSSSGRTLLRLERDGVQAFELASGKSRAKLTGASGAHAMALAMDGRTLVTSVTNRGPVLLWDLLGEDGKALKIPASEQEIETYLALLFSDDAAIAYRAGRQLALAGDRVLPLLLKRIQPAPAPDSNRMKSLIADLDSRSFLRRERASRELLSKGELAEPWLRRVLSESTSMEARHRAESILQSPSIQLSDRRLPVRGVELLQWIGTPSAKIALEGLASAADGSRISREAKAALNQMVD